MFATYVIMIIMSSIAAVIFFIYYRRWAAKQGEIFEREVARSIQINELPIADAKIQAIALLDHPEVFTVERTDIPFDWGILQPAESIREFFDMYQLVYSGSGLTFSHAAISTSDREPSMIRIGEDYDEAEIVVHPNGDKVYILDGSQELLASYESITFIEALERNYSTSIYHFIISSTIPFEGEQ